MTTPIQEIIAKTRELIATEEANGTWQFPPAIILSTKSANAILDYITELETWKRNNVVMIQEGVNE